MKTAYEEVAKLQRRYGTSNPFKLLSNIGAKVILSSNYKKLKGFCYVSNRIPYVVINDNLPEEEQRIVAAHELGHLRLHRDRLQMAFMTTELLQYTKDTTELEANMFAADLLITDEEVTALAAVDRLNFYQIATALRVMPQLLSFKFKSMETRDYAFESPESWQSNFLAK